MRQIATSGTAVRLAALITLLAALPFPFSQSLAGEKRPAADGNPPLLTERPLPPARENAFSNRLPQPDPAPPPASPGPKAASTPAQPPETAAEPPNRVASRPGAARTGPTRRAAPEAPAPPLLEPDWEAGPEAEEAAPTPEAVETYRRRLEERLLERYNNISEYAGKVARVAVVLAKPVRISLDGSLLQAEFDQLAYDVWGERIPALEKEYFVVTFGSGGAAQVRSDPSIRIGLDLEKTYSERVPLAADPFRNIGKGGEFGEGKPVKTPSWWRPGFADPE